MSLSIIIVLYNCKTEESETIKSILSTNTAFSKTRLCIWNNGPVTAPPQRDTILSLNRKGISTVYIETLQNAPLSWIYNSFIDNFKSEKYVILDHDSSLSENYISYMASDIVDFLCTPIINAKGSPRSPTANGKFSPGPFRKNERVIAIGSGIIISQVAALHVKSAYGGVFDERFFLYGVDTSFFTRIFKLGLSDRIQSAPGFEHSLSRLEDEPEETRVFRSIERSYDLGLMLRCYPQIAHLKTLAKQIALTLFRENNLKTHKILATLAAGYHKKCGAESKKEFQHELARQLFHE